MGDIPIEMLLALMPPMEAREFCNSTRRNKYGRKVVECSFHPAHENDHRDVHTGNTWK